MYLVTGMFWFFICPAGEKNILNFASENIFKNENFFSVQASQDEAKASKEVIGVLRKQVQTLQREKETLSAMKPELSEGQLIDILRWKTLKYFEVHDIKFKFKNSKFH